MYGQIVMIEAYDADAGTLAQTELIEKALFELPAIIGMNRITKPTVIRHLAPPDPDWGLTGFVIIAESHIALHTYPTLCFLTVDIYSCKEFDGLKAGKYLKDIFLFTDYDAVRKSRGNRLVRKGRET